MSRTRSITNVSGQVIQSVRYFDLGGITYSTTSSKFGTSSNDTDSGNYHQTLMKTSDGGWGERTTDSTGTITRRVFDTLGRVTSTWIGTNDSGATHKDPTGGGASGNNMEITAEYVYDGGLAGDGKLTKMIEYSGDTDAERVSLYHYDWRNRLVASHSGLTVTTGSVAVDSSTPSLVSHSEYDNLNRIVTQSTYAGDSYSLTPALTSGVPNAPSSGELRTRSKTYFDDQGRVYRSEVFEIAPETSTSPSPGTVGGSLKTNTWYDARGNVIKSEQPGGLVSKTIYDGAGRPSVMFTTDGGGDSGYGDADDVVGDNVLEQNEYQYDANGNVVGTIHRQRHHDETATGDLTMFNTESRDTYTSSVYDAADRLIITANSGTTGESGEGIFMEAENAHMSGLFMEWNDAHAGVSSGTSGGKYVRVPNGYFFAGLDPTDGTPALMTFTFSVSEAGWYKIASLSNMVDTGANSFHLQVDDRSWDGIGYGFGGGWAWDEVGPYHGGCNSYYLDEGAHTIRVALREDGTLLDKIAVLPTSASLPTGFGPDDQVLATTYEYDAAGRVQDVTDSRGITTRTEYDLLGRTTRTIESFDEIFDDFSRPGGVTDLDGSLVEDGDRSWETHDGTCTLGGGEVEAAGTGDTAAAVKDSGTVDGHVTATLVNPGEGHGLVGRFTDMDNHLRLEVLLDTSSDPKKLQLSRRISGVWSSLHVATLGTSIATGDKLTLEIFGNTARALVNGTEIFEKTHADIATLDGQKWGLHAKNDTSQGFDDFLLRPLEEDTNRGTAYTYDGVSNVLTLTAEMPFTQPDQTTRYEYAATSTNGDDLESNNILTAIWYPDPTDGLPDNTAQRETFSNNRLGQRTEWTDRNGTTHEYEYDVMGRLGSDRITTFGSGVNDTVDRLTYSFDDAGRPEAFTSRDTTLDPDPGADATILNRVQREYNGFGQLVKEYQEHDGNVDSFTPFVAYAYSEDTTNNHSRMTSMTYPNGRVLHYNYNGSTLDGNISRLSALNDSSGASTDVLESFTYLGLGTVVQRGRGNGIDLTHVGAFTSGTDDGGDQYVGFDRFGRIEDMRWTDGTSDSDSFTYGHDRNGNRLYERNNLDAALSELYADDGTGTEAWTGAYDRLNRLRGFQRGTLNAAGDAMVGTASRTQEWNLDRLGNMPGVTTNGVTQFRATDSQNRLTAFNGSGYAFEHSPNGEMTWAPHKGDAVFAPIAYTYDAWGRMVFADPDGDGQGNGVFYEYDALNRRIARLTKDNLNNVTSRTDNYHSAQWQTIEERNGSGTPTTQYVWSPVYVDAMIVRDTDANSDGDTTDAGDERLYVLHDANFNVTAIADDDGSGGGTVLERYIYDPYGVATVLDANWASDADGISDHAWQHLHQGGRLDAVTGLHHFRNRDYDATLMRWTRQDPLGYVDGANMFQFVGDSPTNGTDPMGLYEWDTNGPYFKWDGCTCYVYFTHNRVPNWADQWIPGKALAANLWRAAFETLPDQYESEYPLNGIKESDCNAAGISALIASGGWDSVLADYQLARATGVEQALLMGVNNADVTAGGMMQAGVLGVASGIKGLSTLGRAGRGGPHVREVTGNIQTAARQFNKLRGKNPVEVIKMSNGGQLFRAKSVEGGTLSLRTTSKSGPPTLELHNSPVGGVKIKYVS